MVSIPIISIPESGCWGSSELFTSKGFDTSSVNGCYLSCVCDLGQISQTEIRILALWKHIQNFIELLHRDIDEHYYPLKSADWLSWLWDHTCCLKAPSCLSPSVLTKFIHPFIYSDVLPDLPGCWLGVGSCTHACDPEPRNSQTNLRDKEALNNQAL